MQEGIATLEEWDELSFIAIFAEARSKAVPTYTRQLVDRADGTIVTNTVDGEVEHVVMETAA